MIIINTACDPASWEEFVKLCINRSVIVFGDDTSSAGDEGPELYRGTLIAVEGLVFTIDGRDKLKRFSVPLIESLVLGGKKGFVGCLYNAAPWRKPKKATRPHRRIGRR